MKRMNRKMKIWLIVLASAVAMIVQFAIFVVVANISQQNIGDKTFSTKEAFKAFVEQLEQRGAVIMEDEGYYHMMIPKESWKNDYFHEAIAYPLQQEREYYLDYQPYQQSMCKTMFVYSPIRNAEDVTWISCIRHGEKDLFRLTFFLRSSSNTFITYNIYDATGELKGTITNKEEMEGQTFFFVQDASEYPTFTLNETTYRIEDKKLIRVD